MHKSLAALVVFGVVGGPVSAQTAPLPPAPPAAAPQAPPAAGPKMIKKVVCERVVIEETTGSRLGSAPKKCRTIEVPENSNRRTGERASSERG